MYSFDFDLADIEELTLVDNIPTGMKTKGEATDKYSRGHFRLKELGKIRTDNGWFFLERELNL
jgi:hypothetical protein